MHKTKSTTATAVSIPPLTGSYKINFLAALVPFTTAPRKNSNGKSNPLLLLRKIIAINIKHITTVRKILR
jgi:hypothetical protein